MITLRGRMQRLICGVLIATCGCGFGKTADAGSVKEFDDDYAFAIESLFDSLSHALGTDRSYLVRFGRSLDDTHFWYSDSTSVSYPETSFRFTKAHRRLLSDALMNNVWFDAEDRAFRCKLFLFEWYEPGDKTVCLTRGVGPDTAKKSPWLLYAKANRRYLLCDDE